jgi:hypothetical protein
MTVASAARFSGHFGAGHSTDAAVVGGDGLTRRQSSSVHADCSAGPEQCRCGISDPVPVRHFRLRRHRRVSETEWEAGHSAWLLDLAGPPEGDPKIARD